MISERGFDVFQSRKKNKRKTETPHGNHLQKIVRKKGIKTFLFCVDIMKSNTL